MEWTVFAFDRFCSLLSGESGRFEEFRALGAMPFKYPAIPGE
jgi:hypothetical protein